MKHITLLVLSFLFLIGCYSNPGKDQKGALSQIRNFEVYAFFSPYEKFDRDSLFNTLVESLKLIGKVEIIEVSCKSTLSKTRPLLFLSLGGYQEENKGYIEIISPVVIEVNQARRNCTIWHRSYQEEVQDLPYPIIKEGKVAFKRGQKSSSALEANSQPSDNAELILKQLIGNFASDYQRLNLKGKVPTFYVYRTPYPLQTLQKNR